MDKIKIYTDGGSRGNPGHSGIGVVINYENKTKEYAEYLGKKTNNEAEYQALIFALEKAKKLIGREKAKKLSLECYSDSELMVKQLNHQYKLRDENIQRNFIKIWNLMLDFFAVSFHYIPREQNKEADVLANRAMDAFENKLL